MPSFNDPQADSDELAAAARGLAHGTRVIATPDVVYGTLGSVNYALRAIQQSLSQLADWHARQASHAALDNGDSAAGHGAAMQTARLLREAARHLDTATDVLDAAHSENGRIAWQLTRRGATLHAAPHIATHRQRPPAPPTPSPGIGL